MRTPLLIKIHTFLVVCCLSIMCANAQVTGMPTGYITITPTISTSAAPVWYNMMATNTDAARVNRYMYYDGTSLKTDLFNAPGITDALQHDKYMWRLEQGGTGASYVLFVNKSTGKRIYADAGIASNGVLTMAVSGIEWKMAAASTVTTGTVAGQYCFDFLPSIRYLNAGDATTSWGILVFNGAASPAKSSGWFFYPVTTTKTVTFAQAANGTIALTATNGTATPSTLTTGNAVVVGTVTTVAITAATGYRLGTLTVNGTDVTAQVTNSSYSFPVNVNATVAATFTLNTPTITSFTPTLQRNGSSVTITGTYFTGATAVSFGGTAATSYTVNSNTQITATVGAGTSGNVSVTNPLGTGSLAGFVWSPVVCYDGGTSGANNFWLTHFYYAKCTDYVGSNTKEVAGSDYLDYNGGSNINFTNISVANAGNYVARLTYFSGSAEIGTLAVSVNGDPNVSTSIPLSLTSTTLDILVTLVAGTNSIKLTQSSKWPRVLGIQLIPVHIYISSGNFSDIGITEDQLANTTLTVSSGEFVIDATKTVMSLTIAPGAKLTLSSGSLTATNGITLQSDATGTATFVDANNTAPQAVSGTVQQYLGSATARNWYITPPVTGASVPSGQTYFSYDETGSNTDFSASGTAYWKPEAATSSLDSRKGYIVQTTGITTLNFSGTLNTGTQTPLTLTRTNSVSKPGFNLVANPYPSYLDWKLVSAENTGLLTTAWFRTKNNSGGYIFATVNVATPSSPVIVAVDPNTTITTKIPPMQAYWVRVNAVGSTTYTVNNLMRSHADNTGNKFKAPASAQIKQPLLRLQVSNGTDADETVVLFNANATNGMDMFDSPKMSNNSASIPEIYTQVGNENLVINGMKEITYNTEIPIGFSTLTANDFSISANEVANFEAGTKVILIDKLNPTVETELSNGTAYNFTSPITTPTTDRFSLLFRAPGTVTSAKNITKMNAQVFVNAANQITIIAPPKTTYSIFNAMGQKQNGNILGSSKTTIENAFGAGVYFVELTVNGRREIQKVVIR